MLAQKRADQVVFLPCCFAKEPCPHEAVDHSLRFAVGHVHACLGELGSEFPAIVADRIDLC